MAEKKRAIDGASTMLLTCAESDGLETCFDRSDQQGIRCGFGTTGLCCRHCGSDCQSDTAVPDLSRAVIRTVLDDIRERLQPARLTVVLTGGEPMLFAELIPLSEKLARKGHHLTVETAGTLYLPDEDRFVAADTERRYHRHAAVFCAGRSPAATAEGRDRFTPVGADVVVERGIDQRHRSAVRVGEGGAVVPLDAVDLDAGGVVHLEPLAGLVVAQRRVGQDLADHEVAVGREREIAAFARPHRQALRDEVVDDCLCPEL